MGIRKPALCLVLLAVLSAADATAGTSNSDLTPGAVELSVSKLATSALPIDVQALAETICDTESSIGPVGKCRLTVGNSTGAQKPNAETESENGIEIEILDLEGPSPLVDWQAAALALAGAETVETSCGVWEASLTLDATDLQPVSPMILKATKEDSSRGTFASVLEMNAILHLINRTTGRAVAYPLRLGIGLAGPWSLAPSEVALPPAQSNLLLFAGWEVQCFPIWLIEPSVYMLQFIDGDCRICFEVPASSGGSSS